MHRFHRPWCLVALLGVARPPSAVAQIQTTTSVSSQTVRLSDGSIYQGEIVELVPGDHLTLRLVSGEIKRFSWSEFQPSVTTTTTTTSGSVVVSGVLPGILPGVFGGTLGPPPLPPPAPEDLVPLHFQADDPAAVLFATRASGNIRFNSPGSNFDPLYQDWYMLCPRAPCDVKADRRQIYSIQGPWIVRSLPFTLPQGNAITMDVSVAHQGRRTFFNWMSVLGGLAASGGLALLIAGAAQDIAAFGGDSQSLVMQQNAQDKQHTYYVAGGAMLGGGLVLMAGMIIASAYSRTSVNFTADGHVALRLPGKSQFDLSSMQVRY